MAKNKREDTIPLIQSTDAQIIGGRFMVKASIYDDGMHPQSVMLVITDLIERNFKIQFFKNQEKAADLLKLLNAASQP